MTERDVLQQRVSTLQSLLESPGGPFGSKAAPLASKLAGRWRAELMLIARILEDCPEGQDLQRTLDLWQARTSAFMSTSDADRPGWSDRQGRAWDAIEVLEILADIHDRLRAWRPKAADAASDPAVRPLTEPRSGSTEVSQDAAMPESSRT